MAQHSLKYRLYHLLPFMQCKHLVDHNSIHAALDPEIYRSCKARFFSEYDDKLPNGEFRAS